MPAIAMGVAGCVGNIFAFDTTCVGMPAIAVGVAGCVGKIFAFDTECRQWPWALPGAASFSSASAASLR